MAARKRIVRLTVFQRAARPLLVRLLTPYADDLTARGLSLSALAATVQDDPIEVRRFYAAICTPPASAPPLPAALLDALAAIDGVATAAGRDSLLRADVTGLLPRGRLGDETLAVTAYLDHPALFASARRGQAAVAVTSYTVFEAADARTLDILALLPALREALAAWFEAHDRTRHCDILPTDDARETHLELFHGRNPATRERIDPDTLGVSQSTDAWTHAAVVRYEKATGRLLVHASGVAIKEAIRRVFSDVCAGVPDFFRADVTLDLTPIRDLTTTLSNEGIDGLDGVEIRLLEVVGPNGEPKTIASHGDLRKGDWKEDLPAMLARGTPRVVRLYLFILGRKRGSKVELTAPRGVEYVRDDEDLDRIVTAFLVARGILLVRARDVAKQESGFPDRAHLEAMPIAPTV